MEAALLLADREMSDTTSVGSDISESFGSGRIIRKPGSGRRKQKTPFASPWSHCIATDYAPSALASQGSSRELHVPSRLAATSSVPSCLNNGADSPTPTVNTTGTASGSAGGRRRTRQDLAGPCNHCGAVTSPQWRKGPKGKPILCNACGIRFLRTRTLGKTMPKKRRTTGAGATHSASLGGPDAGSPRSKRVRQLEEAVTTEDEEASQEGLGCGDDGAEEAYSALAALHPHHNSQLGSEALPLGRSRLAIAASAMHEQLLGASAAAAAAAMRSADDDEAQAASSVGHASDTTLLLPATAGGKHAQLLAAGSRHVLLGSAASGRVSSSLCSAPPSLALALALQQQYSRSLSQQGSGPHSPALAGISSEHGSNSSPMSHASAFHLGHSDSPPVSPMQLASTGSGQLGSSAGGLQPAAAGVSALLPSRPHAAAAVAQLPHAGSLQVQQLAQQPAYLPRQLHGLHGPSPLSLGGSAGGAQPPVLATAGSSTSSGGSSGDMMQLVSHLGSVLGGMGPAVEFLKGLQVQQQEQQQQHASGSSRRGSQE